MNNTVSVIIPTWNSAHTLEATIKSCLNQTYPPIEILVCDDGSTDNSHQLITSMNDTRVKWLHGEHSGTPAVPRNRGIKNAIGTWVAFCDSDDLWLPKKLEKQMSALENSSFKAIATNAIKKQNNTITTPYLNYNKKIITFFDLLKSNTVICSSAIIHHSIIINIDEFPEEVEYKAFEDYVYWLRVASQTTFIYMNESLVIYDDHPTTSIRSTTISDKIIKKRTFDNFLQWSNKKQLLYYRLLIKSHLIKKELSMYYDHFCKKNMNKKIGILYICTGNYTIFWKEFYESMERFFIEDAEKHYFVFTDATTIEYSDTNPRIHIIYQENLGWPNNTLMRFHVFLKSEHLYNDMDYLFFCNANLLVLSPITSEMVLPTSNESLVAAIHPGFYNKSITAFTYDRNKKSTAYIAKNEGVHYYAGGLNGGIAADFISAMKKMKEAIDTDTANNVVALWHDESQWNKFLLNRPEIKKLSPSFLYPEGWSIPFTPIILVRDKRKYGGHNLLRGSKSIFFKNFLKKIKDIFYKNELLD